MGEETEKSLGCLKQETCEEEKEGETGDRRKSVDFSTTLVPLAFERVKTSQNSIYFRFQIVSRFFKEKFLMLKCKISIWLQC